VAGSSRSAMALERKEDMKKRGLALSDDADADQIPLPRSTVEWG
jgi:hypothetical protein